MSNQSVQSYTNQTNLITNRFSSKTKSFLRKGVALTENKKKSMVGSTASSNDQKPTQSAVVSNQVVNSSQESKTSSSNQTITTLDKLDTLDKVISEFELNKASQGEERLPDQDSMSQAKQSSSQNQDQEQKAEELPTQVQSRGARKEGLEGVGGGVEAAAAIQFVEHEKTPEIPPEVEKYIKKVEDKKIKAPEEIVVAAQAASAQNDQQYAAKPVIILPITPEIEAEGEKKPPQFSVRWLVEWSKKIVKMFAGRVIYRQTAKN